MGGPLVRKIPIAKPLILVLACTLLLAGCAYIVTPEPEGTPASATTKGWSGAVTDVSKSDAGDLRLGVAIENETGDWSAMQAAADKPAVLTSGGKTTNCDTVVVGTGGHRLAPGFRMRGFTGGTKTEPKIQPIYVECKGAEAAPGSKLSFDYIYVTGEYNYYDQQANKSSATMVLNLDDVAQDLKYPVAAPMEGLIQKPGAAITAINDTVLTLTGAARTDKGMEFNWQTSNPGEYPTYVHIGNPPVLGSDGILYGFYESPDLASVPVTGAGKTAEWTTQVAVPKDVAGLYMLLSVESKKQRLFVNYAVDLTDK
jgi:hypothetical protein